MTTVARDIMTTPVVSVLPEARAADVAQVLADHRISAVPVCGADGELLGVISEDDVIKPFRESTQVRRDWWLGRLAEGEQLSSDFLAFIRHDARSAREIMTRAVFTADERATLPELAEPMVAHRVKRVPILRDGRVVGIVSRSDLVSAIAKAPALLA